MNYDDLVTRLRGTRSMQELHTEAADAIEKLQAELKAYKEPIGDQPFLLKLSTQRDREREAKEREAKK